MFSGNKHFYLVRMLALILIMVTFGVYLHREKTVVLDYDGKIALIKTNSMTVGEFVKTQGIQIDKNDWITPGPNRMLTLKTEIQVKKNVPIIIEVDGQTIKTESYTIDLQEILKKAQILLGPLDRVEGTLDKQKLPICLKVIRVQEALITIQEEVPFTQKKIFNPALKRGQNRTVQEGEPGLTEKSYFIHYENNQESYRKEISNTLLKEAKAEIIEIGTKNTILTSSRSLVNPRKEMLLEATAYTHTGNVTFTGVYPQIGTIAVDPKVIPLGTRLWVEGYGYGIAQDTGGLIKGSIIDLFMNTKEECLSWGRRKVKVYILD